MASASRLVPGSAAIELPRDSDAVMLREGESMGLEGLSIGRDGRSMGREGLRMRREGLSKGLEGRSKGRDGRSNGLEGLSKGRCPGRLSMSPKRVVSPKAGLATVRMLPEGGARFSACNAACAPV